MFSFYEYLISSLPALSFEAKPPISFERFINICRDFIDDDKLQMLKSLSLSCEYKTVNNQTLIKWQEFDVKLRNELVKIRSIKKNINSQLYLRPSTQEEHNISQIAISVCRNPHPLDAEKILDRARWDFLDSISFGHYFDFDMLLIFGYKLLILEKWAKINAANNEKEAHLAIS